MTPSQVRYSSGWSSVCTAIRFSPGTSGMPFGTAHETATPSRSRRRSQCRRVALCSWTTKRLSLAASAPVGPGSGEAPKSRLRRYSSSGSPDPRRPAAFALRVGVACGRDAFFRDDFTALNDLICVAVGAAAEILLRLHREPILQRAGVLAMLGVLDQQLLGLLEAFLLAAAGLVHGLPRRVVPPVLWCLHALPLPRRRSGYSSRPSSAKAALISDRCVSACGKLPSIAPVSGSSSSAYSPTSLASPTSSSMSTFASSRRPLRASAS